MKLKGSLFNKPVTLGAAAAFTHKFQSSTTGTRFSAATSAGDPVITITAELPKSGVGSGETIAEQIARIDLEGKPWNLRIDPSNKVVYISIGGQRPKIPVSGEGEGDVAKGEMIFSFGGQQPKKLSDPTGAIIKLHCDDGSWHVHADTTGKGLNLSFGSLDV